MNIKTFTKKLSQIIEKSEEGWIADSKEIYNIPVLEGDDALVVNSEDGPSGTFILHIIKVDKTDKL